MSVLFSLLFSRKFEKMKNPIKMTDNELKEKSKQVSNLLSARKLKPAFDLLERLILDNGLGEYSDEYFNLEQNYKFMLKYTVEGINDPERQKIYEHLLISTFELADNAFEILRMKYSQSVEYQKKRGFVKHFIKDGKQYLHELESYFVQKELRSLLSVNDNPDLSNDLKAEEEKHTQKIITLFYHFWFFNKLTEDEMDLFRSFVGDEAFPFHEKALMVTGLSMSLLRFFDENKIMLLFHCLGSMEEEIGLRALIGLLIGIYLYDQRMPFYHSIVGRLNILIEDPKFKSNLEKSILQFIRSKETEKIQRKLQDEILPEMIKLSPNLRNKLSLESLLGEGLTEDRNPEWQEILKDAPGLMGKIEELTEMQLEGADVFLS